MTKSTMALEMIRRVMIDYALDHRNFEMLREIQNPEYNFVTEVDEEEATYTPAPIVDEPALRRFAQANGYTPHDVEVALRAMATPTGLLVKHTLRKILERGVRSPLVRRFFVEIVNREEILIKTRLSYEKPEFCVNYFAVTHETLYFNDEYLDSLHEALDLLDELPLITLFIDD